MYEESLASSKLNSNLLKFHCAHPNVHTLISGSWGVNFSSAQNYRKIKDGQKKFQKWHNDNLKNLGEF